jgi:hypothetical protein
MQIPPDSWHHSRQNGTQLEDGLTCHVPLQFEHPRTIFERTVEVIAALVLANLNSKFG